MHERVDGNDEDEDNDDDDEDHDDGQWYLFFLEKISVG